ADQPVKRLLVSKRAAKFNPGRCPQKRRQLSGFGSVRAWQEYGDDSVLATAFPDPAIDGGAHLFVLPDAKAAGPDEDGAGGALVERPLDGRLPRLAWDEIPLVEPRLDSLAAQPPGHFLDRRLVDTVVREKDVELEPGHECLSWN